MKTTHFIIAGLFFSLLFASCDKEDENLPEFSSKEQPSEEAPSVLPDGYFEVILE